MDSTLVRIHRRCRRIALSAAVLLALGCSGEGTAPNTTPPVVVPPTPTATNAVTVMDDSFDPEAVTVSANTTVTWTWNGSNPHNVTFDDGVGSSNTQSAGTHTRTFAAAGSYPYHCTVHGAGMAGSVTVP